MPTPISQAPGLGPLTSFCLVMSLSNFCAHNAGSAFNQDIDGWDISSATDMQYMFSMNGAINQELCTWGSYYDSSVNYHNMFYASASCTALHGMNTPQSSLGPWCSCRNTESPTSSPTLSPSGVRDTLDQLIGFLGQI